MKRKLSYKALLLMDGAKVIVHDLEYDYYDQICEVKIEYKAMITKGKKHQVISVPVSLKLVNDEFVYTYDWNGKCENGDFEVYV